MLQGTVLYSERFSFLASLDSLKGVFFISLLDSKSVVLQYLDKMVKIKAIFSSAVLTVVVRQT